MAIRGRNSVSGVSQRSKALSLCLLSIAVSVGGFSSLQKGSKGTENRAFSVDITASLVWSKSSRLSSLPRPRIGVSLFSHESQDSQDSINSSERLEDALGDLFRVSAGASGSNVDPQDAYSMPNLESIVVNENDDKSDSAPESHMASARPVFTSDQDESNDGLFLDENVYLQSRDILNPDGSLNLPHDDPQASFRNTEEYRKVTEQILLQHPELPPSLQSSQDEGIDDEQYTVERLFQYKLPDPNEISEELHRKVFEDEEGYLNQSNVFRESLGIDTEGHAAMEAAQLRRGADYRRRQDAAISNLEREIAEFEATLGDSQESMDAWSLNASAVKCFKCGCVCSEEELKHSRSKPICSLCFADVLVAASDKSFVREPSPGSAFGKSNRRAMPGYQGQRTRGYAAQGKSIPRRSVRPDSAQSEVRWGRDASTSDASGNQRGIPIATKGANYTTKSSSTNQVDDIAGELKDDAGDGHPTARDPWVRVEDPDTPGEFFYWNEDTEEMRWEL